MLLYGAVLWADRPREKEVSAHPGTGGETYWVRNHWGRK